MTKFSKKLTTAIATGAVLLNALAPLAFADTNLTVTGNGASSTNGISVTGTQTNSVVQTNTASVTNTVKSDASSGGNTASLNTGGDTFIKTGAATTSVDLSTQVNKNVADVSNCGCNDKTDVTIGSNGAYSQNSATVDNSNSANLFQNNAADISNTVDAKSNSGKNDASMNTGGTTGILTGPAVTNVSIDNAANKNIAVVGGNGTDGQNKGASSLNILGNGAYSSNGVSLTQDNSAVVEQNNAATIVNDVNAEAKSGFNTANENTGGDTYIQTQLAKAGVDVTNEANFNAASTDCGCDATVDGSVLGNGALSDNGLTTDMGNTSSTFQTGVADLSNPVTTDVKSGHNDASLNTGDGFLWDAGTNSNDVLSGPADSETSVSSAANENVTGPIADFTLPNGQQVSFNWNMGGVLQSLNWF